MEELREQYNSYIKKTIPKGYGREERKCNTALKLLSTGIRAVELGVPGQTIDYNLLCDANNGTDRFLESYRESLPKSPEPDMIIYMTQLLFNQVNTSEKFRDLCRRQGETTTGYFGTFPTSDANAARASLNSLIYYIVALIIKTLPKCVPRNNFINFFTLLGLKQGNTVRYHNEPVTVGNITINNIGKKRFRLTRKNYILRNSRAAGRNTANHYLAGTENISEPTNDNITRNAEIARRSAEAAEAARRNAEAAEAARRNAEAAEAARRNAELVAEATRRNAEVVAEASRRNALAANLGMRGPLPPLPQRPPRLTLRVTSPPPPSPSLLQRTLEFPSLPPSPGSPPPLFGGKRRKTRKNKKRV